MQIARITAISRRRSRTGHAISVPFGEFRFRILLARPVNFVLVGVRVSRLCASWNFNDNLLLTNALSRLFLGATRRSRTGDLLITKWESHNRIYDFMRREVDPAKMLGEWLSNQVGA
jgi:hypothetical protein